MDNCVYKSDSYSDFDDAAVVTVYRMILNMDIEISSKYAVLVRNMKLRLHQTSEILVKDSGGFNDDFKNTETISINAGALLRIHRTGTKNVCVVQILDYVNRVHIYENLYECHPSNLRFVNENLWPFIIAIMDQEQRVRMLEDGSHCSWLITLNKNDFVRVRGEMFNEPAWHYDCIIHYIGPVMQINPVGYFFGLEILESHGSAPQVDKSAENLTYMSCDPLVSIYATSNWITKIPKEQEKKITAFEIIRKLKSAFVPSSSVALSVASNTSSLKSDKKNKKNKTSSSQFYDIEDQTELPINNNNNSKNMERNKKDLLNLLHQDNEEFKQSVENRETILERRATTTAQTQTQPKNGILKNKHKDQAKISSAEGPEIVVINNNSAETESKNVILVESQDVELADLLGNHWPPNAGNAAAILNKQKLHNISSSNAASATSSVSKSNRSKANVSGNNVKKANDSNSSNNKSFDNKKIQKSSNNKSIQKKCDKIDKEQPLYSNTSSDQIGTDAVHEPPEFLPAVLDSDFMKESLKEVPNSDLGLGSMVEVNVPESDENLYGVIRWIGSPTGHKNILIGVELEDDYIDKQLSTTDGGFNGISLFKCPSGRGFFVNSEQCSIDRRFLGADGGAVGNGICETNDNKTKTINGFHEDQQTFGHMECPIVPGAVAPIKYTVRNGLENLCGKFKGIQGHHNSCYLDVTLFSMFAFTPAFDAILYRPPESDDISHYTEVQTVLREEIVNPLRKHMFVRADRVMKLRQLLDKLSSVSGLTSEEKDPEEFLNCLLSQIMRAEPFLKLNSGQDAYYYQLFVDKDERLSFPSVQQLFEQSFYTSDIKLKEVPSCLIIQMPRFGKNYKMYSRILPSQVLDVTDIIDDSPRQCSVCGKLAEYECRDCFGALQNGVGLESTSFCPQCLETVHKHIKRANHKHRKLSVPQDFIVMPDHMNVPRLYMELFAVVCIETSHYVTFVKAGSGPDAPWCFFDSMADRKGEQNGYNIPEMITVPDLPQWLSEDGARTVNETSSIDKMLPEHAKRLFCDAYMCMYQSTDVMMYR